MAARCGLFALILFWSLRLGQDIDGPQLIVWNVGQGQWSTFVDQGICWHIDAGGEHAPWKSIRQTCGDKQNRFSFSHWDWDHVSFAARALKNLSHSCLSLAPQGKSSRRKMALMEKMSPCPSRPPFQSWQDRRARNSNDLSRIFLWRQVLLPGDSSKKEERLWLESFAGLSRVHWLLLGHHGSRTSTSEQLLYRLPALRGAIASARWQKYGHPHAEVRAALLRHRIPLLSTEEWGSLHIDL